MNLPDGPVTILWVWVSFKDFQGCSILPPVNAKLLGFPAPAVVISLVFKATVEMRRRGEIRTS